MKKCKHILMALALITLLVSVLCVPAFAVSEADVEAQVAASGKEAVAGNLLIWFLCAVAFLKVSQKVDSFMATLGVNVGRTGGSLLAEAMIAMRAVTMVVGGGRGGGAGRAGSTAGSSGGPGSSGMAGFFKGGLVGMAGRHITNSAVKTATTQTSAFHTAQGQASQTAADAAAHTAADAPVNNEIHTGGSSIHTENKAAGGGTPPQDGVIVTGSGSPSPASTVDSTPPIGPVPGNAPPQDGVILTAGEAPISVSPADTATPLMDTPADGVPVDLSPPQEGVSPDMTPPHDSVPTDMATPQEGAIVTGGDTSIHAPQTGDTVSISPAGSTPTTSPAGAGGERHTQTSSERVQASHTAVSSEKVQTSRSVLRGGTVPTLGGMVFSHSLASGGSFANNVIGTVARGEVAGSITVDLAAQSLTSYMGYASPNIGSRDIPTYSDVEIGRGRITGVETAAGSSEGRAFAMYHAGQYIAPSGEYSKVFSADGTQWYKQYAQDAVERKPYMAPDDTVAYHEKIVKKLPDPPKRKDRI